MARNFNNVKAISALVADGFSNSIRRGYATAATQNATRGVATSTKSGEDKVANANKVAWVPDPVTGYYKPENTSEVDVSDPRVTVLGKKIISTEQ